MENLNFILVFMEGLLSFFSPCVLPIMPVYLTILSNSTEDILKNKNFKSSTLLKNTIFFVLGICTTFFLLSMTISAFSQIFLDNKKIVMIIGGLLIIFMGVFYMDLININMLQREKRLNIKLKNMNIFSAYILGFTFSFGWTPCIGPMLSSVIIMASNSKDLITSNLLVSIYSIGFILPFIILAMFYKKIFEKFNNVKKHIPIIKKIGGVLLIISGLIMLFDGMAIENEVVNNKGIYVEESNNESNEVNKIKALDFSLYDQYGKKHTLTEYKGKTIFLNIWATWCPPCTEELRYIEEIYKEYSQNKEDIIILGLTAPNLGNEGSKEDIIEFLNSNKYTFPVVFDENAELIYQYGIQAFPTTFIIDKDGYITQYIPGAMEKTTMKYLIENFG